MHGVNRPGGVCFPGYTPLGGLCYVVLPVTTTWGEAQNYCEAYGGSLAVIESASEQALVVGFLTRIHDSIPTNHVWLGGTDLLQEGSFVAPKTLKPLTYFSWAPNQPDNVQGQHCLGMFTDINFLWDDEVCEHQHPPLCKTTVIESALVG